MKTYKALQLDYNKHFKHQLFKDEQCGHRCLQMILKGKMTIDNIVRELKKEWSINIYTDIKPFLEERGYKVTYVERLNLQYSDVPVGSIIRLAKPNKTGHFVIKNDVDEYFDPSVGKVTDYNNYYTIFCYLQIEEPVNVQEEAIKAFKELKASINQK